MTLTAAQTAAEAQALVRLQSMTASATAPVLSEAQLAALLAMSRLADNTGAVPLSADWVPTYDLNRGAAEGWRWKAALLATAYDFTADGSTFHRSQQREMCEKMVTQYQRRIVSSASVFAPLAAADPVTEDEE